MASAAHRDASEEFIFTPYITVKGKRIYHPSGGVFRIPVKNLRRKPKVIKK